MRSSRAETAAAREFEEYLIIAHYYSVRAACHGQKSLVKKEDDFYRVVFINFFPFRTKLLLR